ncbi:MAG: DUF1573 domain-containing protein [Pseudarcicella sp.]|jgi:hypothetical protein|nr:DUF1573 domain-containing protein [Pseudarcicella sp.]MBP6410518.1 DUF1573 domain-containing protein [Pseudarcicella sp.]
MKKNSFLTIALFTLFVSCKENTKNKSESSKGESVTVEPTKVDPENAPVMKFEESSVDLGKLTEGDTIIHVFKFTNTGKSDLVLNNVNASCGCTTPMYTKEPVAPGEKGEIKVKFNSTNKEGKQNKTVTAYANTIPSDNMVSFKVEVLPRKKSK